MPENSDIFRGVTPKNFFVMRTKPPKIGGILFSFGGVLAEVLTSAFFCCIFAPSNDKRLTTNDKNMKDKLTIQLLTAALLSIGGLIMLYCGVFIDPQGQVHESLLVAFGEIATFAGALMGIDYVYKKK